MSETERASPAMEAANDMLGSPPNSSPISSSLLMRKGLFGNSASLLKAPSTDPSPSIPQENDSLAGVEESRDAEHTNGQDSANGEQSEEPMDTSMEDPSTVVNQAESENFPMLSEHAVEEATPEEREQIDATQDSPDSTANEVNDEEEEKEGSEQVEDSVAPVLSEENSVSREESEEPTNDGGNQEVVEKEDSPIADPDADEQQSEGDEDPEEESENQEGGEMEEEGLDIAEECEGKEESPVEEQEKDMVEEESEINEENKETEETETGEEDAEGGGEELAPEKEKEAEVAEAEATSEAAEEQVDEEMEEGEEKQEDEEGEEQVSEGEGEKDETEDAEQVEEDEEEEEEVPQKRRRSTRATPSTPKNQTAPTSAGRRSSRKAITPKEDKEEKPTEDVETATPRSRRSIAKEAVAKTPSSATTAARGRRSTQKAQGEHEEEEEEKESNAPSKTPRGRKSVAADPEPEETVATSARRSSRKSIAVIKTEKTPLRAKAARTPSASSSEEKKNKKTAKDSKEEEEKDEDMEMDEPVPTAATTPKPRARGRQSTTKTPSTPAPASAKKTPAKGKAAKEQVTTPKTSDGEGKTDEDPYDFDEEHNHHPEPLKNIHMEKQSFGSYRFSKMGTGKYSQTEKAAQERVNVLSELSPSDPVKVKRTSLMELNKQAELNFHNSKSAPSQRSKKALGGETPSATPKRGRPAATVANTPKTPASSRKRKASPSQETSPTKKPKVELPQLNQAEQLAADLPEEGPPGILPGSRVFALYGKVYYPAIVRSRDGLGRFQVFFLEDGILKELPEASVIPIASMQPGRLAAINVDEETVQVKIEDVPQRGAWLDCVFELSTVDPDESEPKTYHRKWNDLLLDMEEWKDYIRTKSAHATDVKTDNIEGLEERARRRSRLPATPAAASTPKTPRVKSVKKTPAAQTPGSKRRGRGRPAASSSKEEEEGEEVEERNASEDGDSVDEPTPNARGARGRRGSRREEAAPAEDIGEDEVDEGIEEMDDIEEGTEMEEEPPRKNVSLFLHKTFILTSANRSSAEGHVSFRKNEMKLRILERGGGVVDDINQIPLDADAYLISDTYYRTHKFLAALSRNMPCVSHEWIQRCVAQETFIDYSPYVLKAGVSILDSQVYDLPNIRGRLLAGVKMCVYSRNDPGKKSLSFQQIWEPIAQLLGAELQDDQRTVDEGADILLTDTTCDGTLVDAVENAGGHCVSSEWLIQAIIMGQRPAFDAHPRFKVEVSSGSSA